MVRNLPDRDEIRRVFEFKGNLYTVGIGAVEERWLIQIPDGPILSFDDWRMAYPCLLYTSPSPRDRTRSRMPSSA